MQHHADIFWRRWLREYLPLQILRKIWLVNDEPSKVGDVVVVLVNNIPRSYGEHASLREYYREQTAKSPNS